MPSGTLKMWNTERGFGFIADDGGGPDVFLHASTLKAAGIDPDSLEKGKRLSSRSKTTEEARRRPATLGAWANTTVVFYVEF